MSTPTAGYLVLVCQDQPPAVGSCMGSSVLVPPQYLSPNASLEFVDVSAGLHFSTVASADPSWSLFWQSLDGSSTGTTPAYGVAFGYPVNPAPAQFDASMLDPTLLASWFAASFVVAGIAWAFGRAAQLVVSMVKR